MIIYKDVFTQDEMISDAYEIEVIDDIMLKVKAKMITKGNEEVSIYDGNAFGGKNEEDESEQQQVEVSGGGNQKVNNIVDAFKLQGTNFKDQKEYMSFLKGYMGKLKKHLEENNKDRVTIFMKGVQKFVGEFFKNNKFNDIEFFTGESFNQDAMLVLQIWSEDGLTPYLYFYKDGLIAEKM